MTEGVKEKDQETAKPENTQSDKELNFRRLEEAREKEREARLKAEMQAENLKKEIEDIKNMMKPPEVDPLDELEDLDPDFKDRLTKKLQKEKEVLLKEAQKIAKEVYENERQEEFKKSTPKRLKSEYSDYDQVMNQENILDFEKRYPAMTKGVLMVPDEYERKKLAYELIKSHLAKDESSAIKEKVVANQQNPYMIQGGSGPFSAVDYDLKSPQAREAAYQALKDAQKGAIGR